MVEKSDWGSLSGFKNKNKKSSSAFFVPKNKDLSEAGTVWFSPLQPNIFRFLNNWNKTSFISQPRLRGVKHNTLYCLSCLVTNSNQWVCTAAKVNVDSENGFRLNFSRPTSLSYSNIHWGSGLTWPSTTSAPCLKAPLVICGNFRESKILRSYCTVCVCARVYRTDG